MDTLAALRLFVGIAETGSLSAAARLESVAQSTVTVALRQLEERAGATHITRSTRRLSFTHEGRQFLSRAQAILADWDAAVADARNGPLRGRSKSPHRRNSAKSNWYPLSIGFFSNTRR
jgi:DNA-binding transcriptional LysR family regulator